MRTLHFLPLDHEWRPVGMKRLRPYVTMLQHKHLFMPTRLESFIDYVDLDIYRDIREKFLQGHFPYLANNDEYAFMLLFDLMNGYPANAFDRDFVKLDDQLRVLRRLSQPVDKFFHSYINNSEYKGYLKMDKAGLMKEFVNTNPRTFRFAFHKSIKYDSLKPTPLPPDHKWRMVDTTRPIQIDWGQDDSWFTPYYVSEPVTATPDGPASKSDFPMNMPLKRLLRRMDNADWKSYLKERKDFLKGNFHDLSNKPDIALHLFYDLQGGQTPSPDIDNEKLQNELWVLRQLCPPLNFPPHL